MFAKTMATQNSPQRHHCPKQGIGQIIILISNGNLQKSNFGRSNVARKALECTTQPQGGVNVLILEYLPQTMATQNSLWPHKCPKQGVGQFCSPLQHAKRLVVQSLWIKQASLETMWSQINHHQTKVVGSISQNRPLQEENPLMIVEIRYSMLKQVRLSST